MGARGRLAAGNGMKKGEATEKQVEKEQGLASREEDKNSSGDEIANVNFYAVRPQATRIRWNNAK